MGTKYTTQSASGYNSSPPADDGTQVASNLVTWAGVKTKLADPIKTLADAENTALVAALDLSARAISSPDTAIASDHWKTLQVTGTTAITLSSAASMGAGYEVGVFNAGVGVVTVTPGNAADTINGVSASVTVSIKGTKIFRTNQALTGYNIVGGYDPQTVTASTSVVTPLVTVSGSVNSGGAAAVSGVGLTTKGIDGTTSYIAQQILSGTSGNGAFTQYSDGATFNTAVGVEPTTGDWSLYDGRFPGTAGTKRFSIARATGVIAPTGLVDLTAATAGQIGFPAAQNASAGANVLDDYEEGTWTPGISFGGAAVGIAYGNQTGFYTKIGRMVFLTYQVTLSAKGSSVGAAKITGLPFTAGSSLPSGANPVQWGGLNTTWVNVFTTATASTTTGSIAGAAAAATTNGVALVDTDFTNTTAIIGTMNYYV